MFVDYWKKCTSKAEKRVTLFDFFSKSVILDLIRNGWLEFSYAVKCYEQNCFPWVKTLDRTAKIGLKPTE